MIIKNTVLFFVASLILISAGFAAYFTYTKQSKTFMVEKINFIALGDSYTICEGAINAESWPVLLTKNLNAKGINIALVANPSVTGWTTKDLIDKELPVYEKAHPHFATLLIGVNDWVQKVEVKTFHANLNFIIDQMQAKLSDKKNLILITIPDFGVTPQGAKYSGGRDISQGLSEFNDIIFSEAKKRGLKTVDIFPVSQQMKVDPTLVSPDNLHPSAKEYAIWETLIFPVAYELLKK